MTLPASQYRTFRDLLRTAISVDGTGPSDGNVLSFFKQLLADSAGAPALSSSRQFLFAEIFRRILSGNASNPSDADVVSFWTQLATDASAAVATGQTVTYRKWFESLRGQLSCDALNPTPADLLSYFAGVNSLDFWTTGGYWNLATISAVDDSLVTSTIASAIGSNVLTPGVRKPIVRNNAVRGMPAIYFEQVPTNGFNTLSCDALASSFRSATASWTILLKVRPDKGFDYPVFSIARSDGTATERLDLRLILGVWTLRKTAPGVTNLVATAGADPYGDTYVAVTSNAGLITFLIRESGKATEVITSPGTLDVTNFSANVDRLTVMGAISSSTLEGFSGYLGAVAIGIGALTNAQVHSAFDQLANGDYYGAQAAAVGALFTGSSLTLNATDTITLAGMRDTFSELCVNEALEYYTFGDTGSAGPGQQRYKNSFTSSAGSASDGTILGMVTRAIANSPVPIRYWYAELGTALNNLNTAPATICSTVVADFTSAMNALIAADSRAFATITNITPVSVAISGGLTAANADACHAIWQAQVVAPLQAAFPGRVFFADCYQSLGGAWSAPLFADTTGHLNRAGCVQQSLHPQYGYVHAVNELGETIVSRLRREAKKAAKTPALTARIDSPIVDGTPIAPGMVTFVASTSRVGASCVLKRDGVTLGTMSALELYDTNLSSSDYSKKPHYQNTYTYDATLDSGSHVFTVVATDTDGTTTATSAGVTINFATFATPLTAVTSVVCKGWFHAVYGATDSSGVVTALQDLSGTGNHLAFNVDGAAIVSADATLGSRRSLQFTAGKSLFRSPLVGSIATSFTVYYVMRPDNWVNGQPAININGQAADVGGAPNVSMFNGSYVNATQETIGEWAVYRIHCTNSASDSIKIGARAKVTGANAGAQALNAFHLNYAGGRQLGFRQMAVYAGEPTAPEETALVAALLADAAGVPTS